MVLDFNSVSDCFGKLMEAASGRGVKLILLTGQSDTKQGFLEQCLDCSQLAIVRLGVELSPLLNRVNRDSVGCEIRDFISDLHEDGPVFLDEIELLFDVGMDVNVLSVLKYAARTRLLVVNWPGQFDANENKVYFARGDVQQKVYPLDSEVVIFDEPGIVYPENI